MKVDPQIINYTDFNSLKALEHQAPSEETLKAAAKQLEGVFLQMVLKSMRQANEVFESSTFSSNADDFYQDFHDNQLALNLANGQGLGLAEVIFNQLKPYVGAKQDISTQLKKVELQPITNAQASVKPQTEQKVAKSNEPDVFEDAKDFLNYLKPIAQKAMKGLPLNPSFLLAQAALETGWGKHIIKDEQGQNSFNMFNIKATNWDGKKAIKSTLEHLDGKVVQIKDAFRMYEGYSQSFDDFIDLLKTPRYQDALKFGHDAKRFFQTIQDSGYATDPQYTSKVLNVLNSHVFKGIGQ